MKIKKVLTANLKPGMVSSEAAYTYTNHLVIQSNTVLTEEIISPTPAELSCLVTRYLLL